MKATSDDAKAARAAVRQYTDWLLGFPNVIGCGVGPRTVGGRETDEWSLVVFVTRKLPLTALRSDELVPRQLSALEGTVLTDVVEVGQPEFFQDTAQYNPLVGGCQIGTAAGGGTLGAILYDATDYEPVLLTCNHCLTLPGQRSIIPANASVRQPANNVMPMGQTKRIIPWFPAPLGADHALEAWVDAGIVSPNLNTDVSFNVIDLGKHPYVILPPYVGLEVTKRGFSTETTGGQVKYIDVGITVSDFNGQRVKIGGCDSGFMIKRVGGFFAKPGDSGSLVVDAELGAARGLLFGGQWTVGGFSYACEMGAILQALQLETPCTGGLHGMIRRAILRRRLETEFLSHGSGHSLLRELARNVDRFRNRYMPDTYDGRVAGAFGSTFQSLAVDLAEALYGDEDFAGLLDEAFGEWIIQPTIYDMLEYCLPDDFGQRVLKAFDHLKERRPDVKGPTSWMRPTLSGCGGMKMRELLDSRVNSATE